MSKEAENKFLRAFGVQGQGVNQKKPLESSPSARPTAMHMPMQYQHQLESSRHRTNRATAAAQVAADEYDDGEPDLTFVDETEPLCDQYPDTEQHRYWKISVGNN